MSSGRSARPPSPARSTRYCSRVPNECCRDAGAGPGRPARACCAARAGGRPRHTGHRGGGRPSSGQPGSASAADCRGAALPDLQGPVRRGLARSARPANAPGDCAEASRGRVRGPDPCGFRRGLRRLRADVPAPAGRGRSGVLPAVARPGRWPDRRVHVAAPLAARAQGGSARSRPAAAVRGAAARRGQGRRPAARGGTGMTVVVISGGLTFVIGLLILRPLSVTDGRLRLQAHAPDDDRRRELLRQLRDLDDDLAADKLTAGDHARLREPVEREAAAVLVRRTQGPAGTGVVTAKAPSGPVASGPDKGRGARGGARRWSRWAVTLLALAAAAAGIVVLLVSAVSTRHPGQTITGNSVAGAAPPERSRPGSSAPAAQSGRKPPTRQQLAAVAAAEAQVKQNPKDVSAHLTLAQAYAAAGASQLAAVEYLAVTRLDPTNAEANTNLALLAFEVGRPAQAKTMADRVLAANPNYPEALYVRGLIDLMGLRRPRAAERDFSAYLAVAPFGSHRTAAATLLALAQGQDHR